MHPIRNCWVVFQHRNQNLWCRMLQRGPPHNSTSKVFRSWLDYWQVNRELNKHSFKTSNPWKNGERYVRRRSWGLAILLKGTSSRRAQEHSTTATPAFKMYWRSDGLRICLPLGLFFKKKSCSATCWNWGSQERTHDTTIPLNLDPILSSLINPNRDNFLPEQRRGSQWSKS